MVSKIFYRKCSSDIPQFICKGDEKTLVTFIRNKCGDNIHIPINEWFYPGLCSGQYLVQTTIDEPILPLNEELKMDSTLETIRHEAIMSNLTEESIFAKKRTDLLAPVALGAKIVRKGIGNWQCELGEIIGHGKTPMEAIESFNRALTQE